MDKPKQGKIPVNIIVGRIQPTTLAHIEIANRLYSLNNNKVIFCIVRSKKYNKDKTPFNYDLTDEYIKDVVNSYDFIEDSCIVPTASIFHICEALRPKYEMTLWGTGTDRVNDYNRFINNYGEELNIRKDCKIVEVKRYDDDISATLVRESLKSNNISSFKSLTPEPIHKFYLKLRSELMN